MLDFPFVINEGGYMLAAATTDGLSGKLLNICVKTVQCL